MNASVSSFGVRRTDRPSFGRSVLSEVVHRLMTLKILTALRLALRRNCPLTLPTPAGIERLAAGLPAT